MGELVTTIIGLGAVEKNFYKNDGIQQHIVVLVLIRLFFTDNNDIRAGILFLLLKKQILSFCVPLKSGCSPAKNIDRSRGTHHTSEKERSCG